jgi:hypothetical protein
VLRDLGKGRDDDDGALLLPVLSLYLEVYRREARAGAAPLSSHAREMIFSIAELLATHRPAASRHFAATALVAYVGALPPGSTGSFAGRALEGALAHEPTNPTALLCAAIEAARHGEYEDADRRLEELVRVEPENLEAKVRLAVTRARLGDRRFARRSLAAVVASPAAGAMPPPWWLPVAYQELAALALAAGDDADAERTLRAGLARLPGEEKLSLELALLLTRRHARDEAQAAVAAIVPGSPDRGYDGARYRFPARPDAAIEAAWAELRDRSTEGRARLAAALGTLPRPAPASASGAGGTGGAR